jgi:two-component system, NarL family, invasion response regulator UvrY
MIKIIIADHHQIIREGLKMILKGESDLEITAEAQNEIELVQKIKNKVFSIILLDIDMPGISIINLINNIKQCHPEIPILALSINQEDKLALSVLKAGASGFVCKDSAKAELAIAIRSVMTRGRYLSEAITESLAYRYLSGNKPKPHEELTGREMETMQMLVSGKSVKEIAEDLELSLSTVFTYRGRIFEKLGIKNNIELIRYAIENELIELKSVMAS